MVIQMPIEDGETWLRAMKRTESARQLWTMNRLAKNSTSGGYFQTQKKTGSRQRMVAWDDFSMTPGPDTKNGNIGNKTLFFLFSYRNSLAFSSILPKRDENLPNDLRFSRKTALGGFGKGFLQSWFLQYFFHFQDV